MRRIISIFSVFFLCCCLIFPVSAADLQGGYYVTGDSALGAGLTFYLSSDFAEGALTYDSSGNLFNLSNSSIYLYCPDYPEYTIYASRLSTFQYRSDGSYNQYSPLNLRDISSTNVEIYDEDPGTRISANQMLILISVLSIAILLIPILIPRR